jgi:hypothetical protein
MSTTRQRPPAPWGLFGPDHAAADYQLEIDRSGPIAVATLRAVAAAPRSFATVTQSIRADRYRGQRVRFRATARPVDVVGRAWLWMRVDGPRGEEPLAFDGMRDRGLEGSGDWVEHQVVLDVAQAARTLHFGFALHGTGTWQVRALAFDVVGEKEAVTSTDAPLLHEPTNLELAEVP